MSSTESIVDTSSRIGAKNCAEGRISIAGILLDVLTLDAVITMVHSNVASKSKLRIHTLNVDHVVVAHGDGEFFSAIEHADVVVADGMPIVWLSHMHGRAVERVTGIDLSESLLHDPQGFKFFILGGEPSVLETAIAKINDSNLPSTIVGYYSPDRCEVMSIEQSRRLVQQINASQADILLVALGAPLQEEWLARFDVELRVPVRIGVGATIDFLAGRAKRAPKWMQDRGLEWLYRAWHEPLRLGSRYLGRDWKFVPLVLRHWKRDGIITRKLRMK